MFIAVRPVNLRTLHIDDKVLVFDTLDLTLEYVSKTELFSVMRVNKIAGIQMSYIGGARIVGIEKDEYSYALCTFSQVLRHCTRVVDEFVDSKGNLCTEYRIQKLSYTSGSKVWNIGNFIFDERSVFNTERHDLSFGQFMSEFVSIYVNDEEVYSMQSDAYGLHYAFKYKDMLVLRYMTDISEPCITFVLDKNSNINTIYSDNELIYGDGALRSKIEVTVPY